MVILTVNLISILGLSSLPAVASHAYVHYPPSRNSIVSPWITHCFNVKGSPVGVKTQHEDSQSGGFVARATDFADGMCGGFGGTSSEKVQAETSQSTLSPQYAAGSEFPVTIVYNAQHGGQMEWRLCDQGLTGSMSKADAARCVDQRLLSRQCVHECGCSSDKCKDLSKYKSMDPSLPIFHGLPPKSMEHGAQEYMVPIPSDVTCPNGFCTIQWFWTTAWGEQFWNCFDIRVTGGSGAGPRPSGPSRPLQPRPTPRPTPVGGGTNDGTRCWWTDPPGLEVSFSERNRKKGRVCYEASFPAGKSGTLYYQSKSEVYTTWNTDGCCLEAAPKWGSELGGPANVVAFTVGQWAGPGWCECDEWDPVKGPMTCAGAAAPAAMVCPTSGNIGGVMCTDKSVLSSRPSECGGSSGGGSSEPEPEQPEPEPEKEIDCAGNWENCIHSRCCSNSAFLCYEKDASYAECRSDGCPNHVDWKCHTLINPEAEPEAEDERLACELWCDLPPVVWERKCKWSLCAKCRYCVVSEPEPESEGEPQSEAKNEPKAQKWAEAENEPEAETVNLVMRKTKFSDHLGGILNRQINAHGDVIDA